MQHAVFLLNYEPALLHLLELLVSSDVDRFDIEIFCFLTFFASCTCVFLCVPLYTVIEILLALSERGRQIIVCSRKVTASATVVVGLLDLRERALMHLHVGVGLFHAGRRRGRSRGAARLDVVDLEFYIEVYLLKERVVELEAQKR